MKGLCTCSTRAFAIFVQHATGITVRHHRPSLPRLDSAAQTFGPAPSVSRYFGSTPFPLVDDNPIPFDRRDGDRASLQASAKVGGSSQGGREVNDVGKDHRHEDPHGEIEAVEPFQHAIIDTSADGEGIAGTEQAELDADHGKGFVDDTVVPVFEEPPTPPGNAATAAVPLLPPAPKSRNPSAADLDGSTMPMKSRAESRLQRKLRRIEDGTYRSGAIQKAKEQGVEAQTKSILSLLKAAKGISDQTEAGVGIKGQDKMAKQAKVGGSPMKSAEPSSEKRRGSKRVMKGEGAKSNVTAVQESISDTSTTRPRILREPWQVQKDALKDKFRDFGWQPRKRLSPDTMEGIRALHASDPSSYTTPILAEHFKITPEAIRRILRSKWRPSEDEAEDRRKRWEKRGERKWEAMAAQGVRPPAKWRAKGIRTPQAERKRNARHVGDAHVRWNDRSPGSVGPSLASRIA